MLKLFQQKNDGQGAWLFIGLGNPGEKYAGNRHNVGFMIVDEIASEWGFSDWRSKFQGLVTEGKIDNQKVILLKPTTYMNNSGQSVAAAAKFFKIKPDRVVVFHDELDLEPGKLRLKLGGGNAGHNGLKSIQAHLGTPDFWRVRIGIGHPGNKDMVSPYVLNDFAKTDKVWLEPLVDACAKHAGLLVSGDMNAYPAKLGLELKNAV